MAKNWLYGLIWLAVTSLAPSIGIGQIKNFEGNKRINGTSLFLTVRGKGDPLLLIHGGPGLNHSYFIPYLAALEKEFTVIYYDQRACGRSSAPAADSISLKFLTDDIDAIRKELKVEKLKILGHSWGAVLAAHYALRYSAQVDRLILSNPAMFNRDYDGEAADILKQKTTKQDSTDRARILASGNLDAKKYNELLRITFRSSAYDRSNVSKINLNLPANFAEANTVLFTGLSKDPSFATDLYPSLKSFAFPVLIIHGESDVIPFSSIERLKKEIPHSKLEILKNSGHFPFVEATNSYNQILTTFLKKD